MHQAYYRDHSETHPFLGLDSSRIVLVGMLVATRSPKFAITGCEVSAHHWYKGLSWHRLTRIGVRSICTLSGRGRCEIRARVIMGIYLPTSAWSWRIMAVAARAAKLAPASQEELTRGHGGWIVVDCEGASSCKEKKSKLRSFNFG